MRRPLLVLSALAFLLAACGDDGTTVEAVDLIRASPSAMEDQGTMHMALTVEVADQEISGEGAFDLEEQLGTMTMSLPAPVEGEITMVFDGTTYFMSADAFGPLPLPGDPEWIRFDLDELADLSGTGVDLSALSQQSNNPTDALSGLEGVSEDGLEEIGTDEIRGVEATGYSAEIDMATVLEQLDEQAGGDAVVDEDRAEQFLEQFGDEPIATEVWIDDDGLVRRYVMEMTVQGQETTQTTEMFDYGEPVDVEVPDESDSASLLDLLEELGG